LSFERLSKDLAENNMTVDYYIKMALENGSFQFNLISNEPVEDSENENELKRI
jgi:hypothetical protein